MSNFLSIFFLSSFDEFNLNMQEYSDEITLVNTVKKALDCASEKGINYGDMYHSVEFMELDVIEDYLDSELKSFYSKYPYTTNADFFKERLKYEMNFINSFLHCFDNNNLRVIADTPHGRFYVVDEGYFYLFVKNEDDIFKVYQYFRKLKEIIECFVSHENSNESIKKTSNWSLAQRYELLIMLGVIKKINLLDVSENSKHEIISNILNCNLDNARKIYTGTYNKGKVDIEKLENLTGLIKK